MDSRYETFVGNGAWDGCSIFIRRRDHEAYNNLYTLSECNLSTIGIIGPRYVLYGSSQGGATLEVGDSRFWEGSLSWIGGNADDEGGNVALDPELPDLPDFPLDIDEDCRSVYDFVPEPSHPLFEADFGATGGGDPGFIDADGDGWSWLFDCDDDDDKVQGPGLYYPDADGDGFGDSSAEPAGEGCPPPGFVTNDLDCDDTNPEINPDADERCDDIDWNCDGDPYAGAEDTVDWFPDNDGDGFGALDSSPTLSCAPPSEGTWATTGGDCNDEDDTIYPGASEVPYDRIDQSCDGTDLLDQDLDGFAGISQADYLAILDADDLPWPTDMDPREDCDDHDDTVFPEAPELPYDRIDQSCDGKDLLDQDLDGFAGISRDAYLAILDADDLPWPTDMDPREDCDDHDDTIFPEAEEEPYDRIDQSCDGFDLVDVDKDTWPGILQVDWEKLPGDAAWPPGLEVELDCDDENPEINPGATERCDEIDWNCDGDPYAGAEGTNDWYTDSDRDGFGALGSEPTEACVKPEGDWVLDDTDCDDDDPTVYPGAEEIPYDRVDQSCDGKDVVDVDGDRYPGITQGAWESLPGDLTWPAGLEAELDCDDEDPTVFPGATEIPYDRIDQDCSGQDQVDVDGDRYAGIERAAWESLPGDLTWPTDLEAELDCDDEDPSIFPGATEIPYDRIDQDCSGQDQVDVDGDRYPGVERDAWESLPGDLTWPTDLEAELDCDDEDPTVFPGATEIPYDRIDQSCDGKDVVDVDSDRYPGIEREKWESLPGDLAWPTGLETALDCDDEDPSIFPGAAEIPYDRIDQSCDGKDQLDVDGDTFAGIERSAWESLPGDLIWPEDLSVGTDCNDEDPSIFPGATEIPYDRIDQSCDGADLLDVDGDSFVGIDQADWEALPGDLSWPDDIDPRVDCDDEDPSIFPEAEEIPYDRIDQSCDGTDLLDVDGDSFVGIDQADWEALPGDLSWPEGLDPRVDCDDEDPTIFPGAEEIPGDGVDQSCSGTELCFEDLDGDGWRTEELIESFDISCTGPGLALAIVDDGDCDDLDPEVNPGAEEIWYDGIDQDCDGWSDFDPDRDGTIWPDYVERHETFMIDWPNPATAEDSWEARDCYDDLDSPLFDALGEIDPAQIPREREWYNGIDDDCSAMTVELVDGSIVAGALINDFDLDGDGFVKHDTREDFLAYVERYVSFTRAEHDPETVGPPPLGTNPIGQVFIATFGETPEEWEAWYDANGGDCDDTDPLVFPGSPESRIWTEDCELAIAQDDSRPLPEEELGPELGSGCGCATSSPGGPGGWLALAAALGGLVMRRRRRQ